MVIPDRMAQLPRDARGLPLPYMTGDTGDFRIIDRERWEEIVTRRLCGICAQELDYWIAFVGSQGNVDTRVFLDPGMHVECARYSIEACPFLSLPHARRSGRALPADGRVYTAPPVRERPPRMALYLTRGFEITVHPGVGRAILAAAPKSVEWF